MATFTLEVTHGQIAIFDARLATPFNDWTDAHVQQGFAWRPGSVSFATLDDGQLTVTVAPPTAPLDDDTVERAIRVPFTVPAHGDVEVATIVDAVRLQLEPGEYALTFRHGQSSPDDLWVTLTFEPVATAVKAEVLRADPTLRPPAVLLMSARPA